jgi:phosphoglycolate phosphatase
MRDIKVVAFDCDGVLFDTIEVNRMYYNLVLEYMKRPPLSETDLQYAHMQTAEKVLKYFFKDEDEYKRAEDFRANIDYSPLVDYMTIEPYLKRLLNNLKPKYHTAIATNRTYTMQMVLEYYGLKELFDYVVSALDVTNPKPDPEELFKILDFFKIKSDEIIYIGDSAADEAAAKSAGITFIAYNNNELKADRYIKSLSEVEKILQK